MDVRWMKGLAVHQSMNPGRSIFSKWIRSRVLHFFCDLFSGGNDELKSSTHIFQNFRFSFFVMETGFASQNWAVGTGGFHVFFFCTKLKRFP